MSIQAIIIDIEGTTSSIDFVHKVLFSYASEQLPAYLQEHQNEPEIKDILQQIRVLINKPAADIEALTAVLLKWIEEDNKSTSLKALQGLIWAEGYTSGAFTGHVYEDAVRKMKQWIADGIDLYVYSSGSVAAQKLLFKHSDEGDLSGLFKGHFDTSIGNKREASAYAAIAKQLALPAKDILFLSDVLEELDAAVKAGMSTIQLVRNSDMPVGDHPVAHTFDQVIV